MSSTGINKYVCDVADDQNGEEVIGASVHQNPYLSNPFVAKNRILYFRARLIRINF